MIHRARAVVGILLMCVAAARPARAQDAGKVGIAMAYPAAFGVVWHATDTVAIRPSVTFGGSTSDTNVTGTGHAWNVGTTIAALFYLKKYDNVRTYVSPSYRYARTSTTITPSISSATPVSELKSTGTTNGGAGTFGAEFAPNPHFRIVGEIGFAFSRATSSSVGTTLNTNGKSWGTTAGVGLVFYP